MGGATKAAEDFVNDTSNTLTKITQPVEKAVTAGVEDTSKNLTSALQPVEKAVNYIGAHPEMQVALAFAAAAPYASAQITPYLSALGSYAPAAANAITSITVSVAQGVPIEKATENAVVNLAASGVTGQAAQQINKVISSPAITNAITSTVSSGLASAAKGGSQADVEKAMTAGLAGSTASSLYKSAIDPLSEFGSRVVGGTTAGAVTGGTEGAVIGGLTEAAANIGKLKTEPPVAAPLDQTAAEDARLARQEATLAGAEKGAYLPMTSPDQTEAETARLARQNAIIAGSTKGAYLPGDSTPAEEPKQGAYLPDAGPEGVVAPVDGSKTDTTTASLYRPDIFTKSYVSPQKSTSAAPASTQALGQALGTTTGLTAFRDAGEIEGQGTIGKRKNVWNEESLKLKDALGV